MIEYMKNSYKRYITFTQKWTKHINTETDAMAHACNSLFAQILTYFLPLSVIAVVPGIIMSLVTGLYLLAAVDALAFLFIAYIILYKNLNINTRKVLFIAVIYLLGITLQYYLGSFGPAMLYFLMGTFFTALIFPGYKAYWTVLVNILICIAFTLFYYNTAPGNGGVIYSAPSWIAVSSNLVILSALVAILLPRLFYKLKGSYEQFEIVSKATSDTFWDWDILNDKMKFNNGITGMFGYQPSEIEPTQKWWNDKIHPEDVEMVVQGFTTFFANGQNSLQLEYRFLCADGSYKYILNRATVVLDPEGRPIRMIGVIQDVSKIRNYILAIEEQNTKLRVISWIQSHKVRRPVATILGLAPLLNYNDATIKDNKKIIDGITQSCTELDTIIKEITDYTQTIDDIKPGD